MKYDIIIPSWNMQEVAVKCLKSIQAYSTDYRVIFVDNGSEQAELDNILPVLEQMPHLLIRNEENLGFVKATNKGIEASEAPYLVLMNNDTEAVPGWLEKLAEPLEKNRNIMLSGPLTTTPNSWQGRYPKGKKGYAIRTNGMIAFFCTMFKREVFTKVGMLDERFGVGFGDDDDYCLRVLNAGYVMALVQDLVIPHHPRSTFKKIYGEANIKGMEVAAIDKFKEKHRLKPSLRDAPIPVQRSETIKFDPIPVQVCEGPIDVVYVLGTGSIWKNNEIRFSLRSVARNLSGVGKIWIIGENPGFLSESIRHIQYPDELGRQNADGNMARKILRACREEELSEDFLFMNDDFIINKPVVASEIPWMHKGNMKDRPKEYWSGESYRHRLKRTFETLRDKGYPTLQYDYHAPMLMNKKLFPRCMDQFDYAHDIGLTFRSLYGNYCQLPVRHIGHYKKTVYKNYKLKELNSYLSDCVFVGYNDNGINPSLEMWMFERFPERSQYECTEIVDVLINIAQWLKGDRDYQKGVEIFTMMYRDTNLTRLFRNGKSQQLQEKLEYKLKLRLGDL